MTITAKTLEIVPQAESEGEGIDIEVMKNEETMDEASQISMNRRLRRLSRSVAINLRGVGRCHWNFVLLGPPIIALVIIGLMSLLPLRQASYSVSAANTYAFWSVALNISVCTIQIHHAVTHVHLAKSWQQVALPASVLSTLCTRRTWTEIIAAALVIAPCFACGVVLAYFFGWAPQVLGFAVILSLLFISIECATGGSRLHLLQSKDPEKVLESLSQRGSFYVILQMAVVVLNLGSSMEVQYTNMLRPLTMRSTEAISTGEIEAFCGPSARNESYLQAYCQTPEPSLIGSGAAWLSSCNDGGFGMYPSLMYACLASRRFQIQRSLHMACLSLGGRFLFLFMDDIWEHALDQVWRRKTRLANTIIRYLLYLITLVEVLNTLNKQASLITSLIANRVTFTVTLALCICQVLINLVPTFTILKKKMSVGGDKKQKKHDIFLSHNWGPDASDRDNHERVCAIARGLKEHGINCWLDQEVMHDDLTNQMSNGVDASRLVAVFITQSYMDKAQGLGPRGLDDNCKAEFDYALRRHGVAKMLPVVMENGCKNPDNWTGAIGFRLGSQLYVDCAEGNPLPSEKTIYALAVNIRKRLDTRGSSHSLLDAISPRRKELSGRRKDSKWAAPQDAATGVE